MNDQNKTSPLTLPPPSVVHILTWNPKIEKIPDSAIEQTIMDLENGSTILRSWNVGRHTNNFLQGNLVYLLRQGTDRKGIIAQGKLTSSAYKDTFRKDPNKQSNFVDYELIKIVPVDDRLPFEVLENHPFNGINWNKHFRESGTTLKGSNAQALNLLWDTHLKWPRSKCPSCGDYSVVEIVYGMPGPDLMDAEAEGLVILAGCIMDDLAPGSGCVSCGWQEEVQINESSETYASELEL